MTSFSISSLRGVPSEFVTFFVLVMDKRCQGKARNWYKWHYCWYKCIKKQFLRDFNCGNNCWRYAIVIEEIARVFFWLFTHPDGGAAKLIEAEVHCTRANSEKLNSANKNLSFFELWFSNFSMLIVSIKDNFFAK